MWAVGVALSVGWWLFKRYLARRSADESLKYPLVKKFRVKKLRKGKYL